MVASPGPHPDQKPIRFVGIIGLKDVNLFLRGPLVSVLKLEILATVGAVCDRASFPRPRKRLELREKHAVTDRAYS